MIANRNSAVVYASRMNLVKMVIRRVHGPLSLQEHQCLQINVSKLALLDARTLSSMMIEKLILNYLNKI